MSSSDSSALRSTQLSEVVTCLKNGVRLYLDNFVLLFVCSIIFGVLSVFSFGILAGPLLAGLAGILLNLIDRDRAPSISDIFSRLNIFLETFLYAISFAIGLYLVGRICGAIPLIGGILGFCIQSVGHTLCAIGIFLMVDKKTTVSETFSKSLELLLENPAFILLIGVLASVVSGVGVLVFFIGIFLTVPIFPATMAMFYRSLIQPKTTAEGATVLEAKIVG